MRVLITGGAGFIGANLVRFLSDRGADLRILDDLSTGDPRNIEGLSAELVVGSILDERLVQRACESVDAVVHLAARGSVPRSIADPLATDLVNVVGTLRVLEAARDRGAHLIFSSSSSVYGESKAAKKHEGLVPRPRSPYAVSKLSAESYVLAYQKTFGMSSLAFRFFNVFGPYQSAGQAYAAVIPSFLAAAMEGRPLTIFGDGRQSRDFTYVGSVVAILADALDRRVASSYPVNLAFGGNTSLLDLLHEIEDLLGDPLRVEFAPERVGDIRQSRGDCSRLLSLFPRMDAVPLRLGLERTISWFKESLDL